MARSTTVPVLHPESFFIGGSWVAPSSDALQPPDEHRPR